MNTACLSEQNDPMGAAISDFYRKGKAGRLKVFSSQFEEDDFPVENLFRTFDEMPVWEQTALRMSEGRILDVGAGSGCHSLVLKEMGKAVMPIDVSPLSVTVMKERGLENARLVNFFDECFCERFDTLLFLMNGSGIVGKVEHLPVFFQRVKQLLNSGGCVWMDSSDLRYLFEEEDGSFVIDLAAGYYGEIDFRMQYKQVRGEAFDWLYIDFDTLSLYASQCGFCAEKVQEGPHYEYLAKLTVR